MRAREPARAAGGAAGGTPVHRWTAIAERAGRGRGSRRAANSFAFSLSIPGEVELGSQGLAVGAELRPGASWRPTERQRKWAGRGTEVGVAAGALELPLAVRNRRPGDRFRPLGAPGGRKLQDFLVDRKVPRDERDCAAAGGRRTRPDRVGRRAVGGGGLSGHGPLARRDTLESQGGFRRLRLNSTLKSLLFWMVLVVVGVLIWNFSTNFQRSRERRCRSPSS